MKSLLLATSLLLTTVASAGSFERAQRSMAKFVGQYTIASCDADPSRVGKRASITMWNSAENLELDVRLGEVSENYWIDIDANGMSRDRDKATVHTGFACLHDITITNVNRRSLRLAQKDREDIFCLIPYSRKKTVWQLKRLNRDKVEFRIGRGLGRTTERCILARR